MVFMVSIRVKGTEAKGGLPSVCSHASVSETSVPRSYPSNSCFSSLQFMGSRDHRYYHRYLMQFAAHLCGVRPSTYKEET